MLKRAGGVSAVARACGVSREAVYNWKHKNTMPMSEWTGRSCHTLKIAKLAEALGLPFDPLDICPMSGQYMIKEKPNDKT
ncbi:MAG: hypothetical protein R8M45_00955, partial [Ghiorsea sp.]